MPIADMGGTNCAVYSGSASEGGVSLCLFADDGTETRLPMTARTEDGDTAGQAARLADLFDREQSPRIRPANG